MKKLKIAIIGSGSTYTPELVNGFLSRTDSLNIDCLAMMDIDVEKNKIVSSLAERMLRKKDSNARVVVTENLEEAIEGADYVLGQVRVGKLDARIHDEKIPLKYGFVGQETTGAGGFMKGLRTIPIIMNAAKVMERLAPDAWMINFSNPSGMVAQAVLNNTNIKMMGLCNNAINALRLMSKLAPGAKVEMDYVGLNHLTWTTAVYADGVNILPEHLLDESIRTIDGVLWDSELIRAINAIPCGYLAYYYFKEGRYQKFKAAEKTRGEICKEIEKELLELYNDPSVCEKPAVLDKRGGAMYSEAAASLIDSIENDKQDFHVVNTLNNGCYSFMQDDDVVEIKCKVGKNGPVPQKLENFDNEHIISLMRAVKTYEKLAVKAALTGNIDTALSALLSHPLILDYERAKPMLDELMDAHKAFLPQFNRL